MASTSTDFRAVSSRWLGFHKVAVPGLLMIFGYYFLVPVWRVPEPWSVAGVASGEGAAARLIGTAIWTLLMSFSLFISIRLKRVEENGEQVRVSGLFRTTTLPLTDVLSAGEERLGRGRIGVLRTSCDTQFGRTIWFPVALDGEREVVAFDARVRSRRHASIKGATA